MKKILFLILVVISFQVQSQFSTSNWWDKEILLTENQFVLINPRIIIQDKWDALPQTIFWKQVLTLSKDSCLINVANTRQILHKMAFADWTKQSEYQKDLYKDSLKKSLWSRS